MTNKTEPIDHPPIIAALHSHAAGYTGVVVALGGFLGPVAALLTNGGFVNDLIYGLPPVRSDHVHQIVVEFATGAVFGILGLAGANTGKGLLSPHAEPDVTDPKS